MAHVRTNCFRRLAARWKLPSLGIYDWSTWRGTLIRNIAPGSPRIYATINQDPQVLATSLPPRVRTLLMHLDISVNAPFVADHCELFRVLAERGVKVLNGNARDIRKRTVQACCRENGLLSVEATAAGQADELLFVKTNLNSGGAREQRLATEYKMRYGLPKTLGRLKGRDGYYTCRRADLSADVWNDPDLLVEHYVGNPQDRFFRVYVAADAVVVSEAYTQGPIKRMGGDIRRYNYWLWRNGEVLQSFDGKNASLPMKLLHTAGLFIHRFQLDYGAIDVLESESGDFYIVDVNKTPFWENEHQPGLLKHLRLGFEAGMKTA